VAEEMKNLSHFSKTDSPDKRGITGNSFCREGLAFLGEIAQLKVRDARSISPSGLGEVE
jgi:hypothetical protein